MKFPLKKLWAFITRRLTPVRFAVIVAAALFFWFVVLGDTGVYQLRKLLDMKNRLTAEQVQLNDEIDKMAEEKRILSEPENMEMVIRKELGYVKPGEVVFEERKEGTR